MSHLSVKTTLWLGIAATVLLGVACGVAFAFSRPDAETASWAETILYAVGFGGLFLMALGRRAKKK